MLLSFCLSIIDITSSFINMFLTIKFKRIEMINIQHKPESHRQKEHISNSFCSE